MRPSLLLLALAACTHGPPQLDLEVTGQAFTPIGGFTAVAVKATWRRPPTGLSTFPDGGRSLVLAEAGAIYQCDTNSLAVTRLWRADRPTTIRSEFSPWVGPWTDDGLYLSLRGNRHTTTQADGSGQLRFDFLLRTDGTVDSTVTPPPLGPATSEHRPCTDAALAAARAAPPARLPD